MCGCGCGLAASLAVEARASTATADQKIAVNQGGAIRHERWFARMTALVADLLSRTGRQGEPARPRSSST